MIRPHLQYEKALYKQGYTLIAGMDEAGRGALAGPLVCAAVILKKDFSLVKLPVRDSKLLTPKARGCLFDQIVNNCLCYNVSIIENSVIDKEGIAASNLRTFIEAVSLIAPSPEFVLIDGLHSTLPLPIPFKFIIDGDKHIASIACASIIAKVTRDRLMQEYALKYPQYGFERHKGYGTRLHFELLDRYGPCEIHRKSYNLAYSL